MITPNDITIKRLKDAQVKGNFTIKCENSEQIHMLHDFFWTLKPFIKFKDIKNVPQEKSNNRVQNANGTWGCILITCGLFGDPNRKYIIKYESLNELLKLREVFNIRANKFDMYLIKKRGYDMFTPNFYQLCADMTIYKVKK